MQGQAPSSLRVTRIIQHMEPFLQRFLEMMHYHVKHTLNILTYSM